MKAVGGGGSNVGGDLLLAARSTTDRLRSPAPPSSTVAAAASDDASTEPLRLSADTAMTTATGNVEAVVVDVVVVVIVASDSPSLERARDGCSNGRAAKYDVVRPDIVDSLVVRRLRRSAAGVLAGVVAVPVVDGGSAVRSGGHPAGEIAARRNAAGREAAVWWLAVAAASGWVHAAAAVDGGCGSLADSLPAVELSRMFDKLRRRI